MPRSGFWLALLLTLALLAGAVRAPAAAKT